MENWSHSGIKYDLLKEQFNKVWNKPFPQLPEDDSLDDLFADLVEMDGYIVGAVSTYLKKGEKRFKSLVCDKKFNQLCREITTHTEDFEEIMQYKKELDKLVSIYEDLE